MPPHTYKAAMHFARSTIRHHGISKSVMSWPKTDEDIPCTRRLDGSLTPGCLVAVPCATLCHEIGSTPNTKPAFITLTTKVRHFTDCPMILCIKSPSWKEQTVPEALSADPPPFPALVFPYGIRTGGIADWLVHKCPLSFPS